MINYFWPVILLCAALFEVAGDASSRKGLEGEGFWYRVIGFVMLGTYGILVNLLKWDFSKLLGTYVAFFALVSVWWGVHYRNDKFGHSTVIGLALIVIGGCFISWSEIKLWFYSLLNLLHRP